MLNKFVLNFRVLKVNYYCIILLLYSEVTRQTMIIKSYFLLFSFRESVTQLTSLATAPTIFSWNLSGGTSADASSRLHLRSSCSQVARKQPVEVFKPPSLAFADGSDVNSVFKIPRSRRDPCGAICQDRSSISITLRGQKVQQGAGRLFTRDEEDGELF